MGAGQPFARFDDIWCGIIAKRVMDHLRWPMSVGEPKVEHRRASDPFKNLVKEAPGIAANETFWEAVPTAFASDTAAGCMREVAVAFLKLDDPYMKRLGEALVVWLSLLETTKEGGRGRLEGKDL
jgi:hypothetical protein